MSLCDYACCPEAGAQVDPDHPQWAFCRQHYLEHRADLHNEPWPRMASVSREIEPAGPPHGTEAMYMRHLRRGNTPCDECKKASSVAKWARRRKRAEREAALEPCGTRAAYKRHRTNDETPCEQCRSAEADYQRERMRTRRAARPPADSQPLAPCGTPGAYRRHHRAGEPPCAPCKKAEADYRRGRAGSERQAS